MKRNLNACQRLTLLVVLTACFCGACTSTVEIENSYERDALVAVKHNTETDCTLLIYRDPRGQTLHVFRKHGIFEFRLTFLHDGGFELHERGARARLIDAPEAHRVTNRINQLLDVKPASKEHLSSNTRTMP